MAHTDRFYPTPLKQLLKMILLQEKNGEILNIPKELFFKPQKEDFFRTSKFGQNLDTPVGLAAGPHTQLAQNLIGAWLAGARYIELKTIQTLDELEVSKPCIDMQDEGYNCEWSQELKIHQSFDEYLNAWIIIHILADKFGYEHHGTIFNMSVGYNMDGILKENVQWFFSKMNNCEAELKQKIEEISDIYPKVKDLKISAQISDNITLSTMHGCPPDEIEKIGLYLINERKLNTIIKLNPTLLGEQLREILKESGYATNVPDIAFEHDLKYPDALNLIKNLRSAANNQNVFFGLKLTNTLESRNNKDIFKPENEMMYMSGRALHQVSVNVARKLQNEFDGELKLSFSAGADAFNISNLLACGFDTITVCSDILKPGGYGRLAQYFEEMKKNAAQKNAKNLDELILKTSQSCVADKKYAAIENLNRYADEVLENKAYKKKGFVEPSIKTSRKLTEFDCISAPCVDTCPTNQAIPDYMFYTSKGEYNKAFETILQTNSFPIVTGMVCDHTCQLKCTRINYDNSLLIRDIKRFVTEHSQVKNEKFTKNIAGFKTSNVSIIGAGPAGISAAYYLAYYGFEVTVYESKSKPGGMVSGAIPSFRLTNEDILKDIAKAEKLGVKILYDEKIDSERFAEICKKSKYVFIAAGAQLSSKMKIENIDAEGVIEPLEFLFRVRDNKPAGIGQNVAIIGGGNTAMDAARTAYRLVGTEGKVTVVYRRTIKEMPADLGEIKAVLAEGVEIYELTAPEKIITENGKVVGLQCSKMVLGEKDAKGRRAPVKVQGSEFELKFDTIIPAIGQDLNIDFIDNELLKSEKLYHTQIENIFIGGDAMRGAATAIKAIADGRKVAEIIVAKENRNFEPSFKEADKKISVNELKLKKAKREFGVEVKETPLDNRQNFNMVTSTLSESEAKKEASRCLHCDKFCNICVTVCPNMANFGYETELKKYEIQTIGIEDQDLEVWATDIVKIKQKHQIINIADWCNECGNCNTFCPTDSAPYIVKPKLHLTKESFENHVIGYYFENYNTLLYKKDGNICKFSEAKDEFIFDSNEISATLAKSNLEIIDCELKDQTKLVTLDILPEMKEIFDLRDKFVV